MKDENITEKTEIIKMIEAVNLALYQGHDVDIPNITKSQKIEYQNYRDKTFQKKMEEIPGVGLSDI